MSYQEIIKFWFEELKPQQWFIKDLSLDQQILSRFKNIHQQACTCELFEWRRSPEGRLAEILILDQFSRNMFRGQATSFSQDPLALALAQEAVHSNADQGVPLKMRAFFYMPYMHSESVKVHETAILLMGVPGLESTLDFERKHKSIIDRFGRYPHRNQILGRTSTSEESEFLKTPGSGF